MGLSVPKCNLVARAKSRERLLFPAAYSVYVLPPESALFFWTKARRQLTYFILSANLCAVRINSLQLLLHVAQHSLGTGRLPRGLSNSVTVPSQNVKEANICLVYSSPACAWGLFSTCLHGLGSQQKVRTCLHYSDLVN